MVKNRARQDYHHKHAAWVLLHRVLAVCLYYTKRFMHTALTKCTHIGYASSDMTLPVDMTGREYVNFVLAQQSVDHTERYEYLVKRTWA